MRDPDGLIARIRRRRVSVETNERASPATVDPHRDEVRVLEARVGHLEQLVQGLQDSVHRESMRVSERVDAVESRLQPAALARAISKDARDRGL